MYGPTGITKEISNYNPLPGMKKLLVILPIIFTCGCTAIQTTNPVKAYQYWAGTSPAAGLTIHHASYWQSGHFTKEYILWMEIEAPAQWRQAFISQNNLQPGTNNQPLLSSDKPSWFIIPPHAKTFVPKIFTQNAAYYIDSQRGRLFIYEIQL
jgi:hypothetical protein